MKIKTNKIIRYFILSDFVFWTGWGLINPIFAIFIIDKIEGGSPMVVGIATAVFWIVKSILRIPIGMFLDKCPSEKDDYLAAVLGLFITSLVPFGFIFAKDPFDIYLLEVFEGAGTALNLAGWTPIFTRHIDKGKESTEWGIDTTAIGIGTAVAGVVGGWAIGQFGFTPVFIVVGILGLTGTALLLVLRKQIKGAFDYKSIQFSPKDNFTS